MTALTLNPPLGRNRSEANPMKFARETWLVFQRQMLIVKRTPIRLVIGIAQPITYLLLFTPFLKPALASMGATSYGRYETPQR